MLSLVFVIKIFEESFSDNIHANVLFLRELQEHQETN